MLSRSRTCFWVNSRPILALSARIACTVVIGGCSGNGSGDTGDPHSKPASTIFGNGARIVEIVGEANWYNPLDTMSTQCASPENTPVNITGQVVNAIDRFDETGEGATGNIYVQDIPRAEQTPLPFSGMTIFDPAFSPPDLRLFRGDVVDTLGNLQEFLGPISGRFGECKTLPEIGGTMSFRFENGPIPPYVLVQAGGGAAERFANLKGYPAARRWLGMLVRLEDVSVRDVPDDSPSGRFSVPIDIGGGVLADQVSINNELFDLKAENLEFATGTKIRSVTGVWTYFYGFHIAPRDASDIEI